MQLVKYDAACRAVAEAKTVDEAREIINRGEALKAYARQAKNKQLCHDAMEIIVRAERRAGELLGELKTNGVLAKQGQFHGKNAEKHRKHLLRLSDLGIDGDDSGKYQRLAALPEDRFEQELGDWRRTAEFAPRMEMPLQVYRIPSIKGDRQRAAARRGRVKIDDADRFGKFIAPDGRRIAGWRAGELDRIEILFLRAADCACALKQGLPIANADPLATMEMLFKPDELLPLLNKIWDEPIPMNDGLQSKSIKESRLRRTRICENVNCKNQFVMDSRGNTAGRFCSRQCAGEFRRTHRKH